MLRNKFKRRNFKRKIFNMLFIIIILLFNKLENVITLVKFKELSCFKITVSKAKKLKKAINLLKILTIKLLLNAF